MSKSSGETGKSTDGNDPIVLVADQSTDATYTHLRLVTAGANPGSISWDGGKNYHPVPGKSGGYDQTYDNLTVDGAVLFKRVTDGNNVTGIFASVW